METLLQDLRYGVRSLLRTPGLALVAVLTLAFGIGANTALFSLLNGIYWTPPAGVRDAEGLVWLGAVTPDRSRPAGFSYPDYLEYRDASGAFRELAAFNDVHVAVGTGEEPQRLNAELVTGNFFSVLHAAPALGRSFLPEEDRTPGTHPVAMISERLWQNRFAGDPNVLGQTIVVNGSPLTVIGVAAKGFRGFDVEEPADVWLPMMMYRAAFPKLETDDYLQQRWTNMPVLGRLAPDVSMERARASVQTISKRLAAAYPESNEDLTADVFPFRGIVGPGEARGVIPIFALCVSVTLIILLIACGNVANLLLARGAGREREIAVRAAMGASRGRIVRQLLVESMVLAAVGGAAGVMLASWMLDLFLALAPIPFPIPVALDWRALLVTMGLALTTGVIFGLTPALRASRPNLTPALKGAAGDGRGRSRPQRALVIAQLALACMLLMSAGLLVRGLQKALAQELDFPSPESVLTLSFDLGMQGYTEERSQAFERELHDRVQALPGVEVVSIANLAPFRSAMFLARVTLDGQKQPAAMRGDESTESSAAPRPIQNSVWPDYFRTLGVPILRGRDFTGADRAGTEPVVIVNELAAQQLWPDEGALGRRIRVGSDTTAWLTVIGVAATGAQDQNHGEARPTIYLPKRQRPVISGWSTTLLVRSSGDAGALAGPLREQIRALDPNLPVYDVATLKGTIRENHSPGRLGSTLLVIFGALALGLAVIGLYGVVSYAVTQRTREIGVRIALGAARPAILGLFARDALRMAAVGIAVGLALAVGAAQVLRSLIRGLDPLDAAVFAGVALLLATVTLLAAYLPARRAARVDPMVALRSE
jgi:predicted permease